MTKAPKGIDIPSEWEDVIPKIESKGGTVLLLGAPDTGKSTFVRFLIDRWTRQGITVGIVDGDVGQSMLGPPTTVGLGMCREPSEPELISMRFVGSTSPYGHMLATVIAIKKLVDKAIKLGAEITLVNTTGLVHGDLARRLKSQKIELINPEHILALQRNNEIEHLLAPYQKEGRIVLHRLPVSRTVRTKSVQERRAFREKLFRKYFENAESRGVYIEEIATQATQLGSGKRLASSDLNFLSKVLKTHVLYGERSSEGILVITNGNHFEEEVFRIKRHYDVTEVSILDVDGYRNLLVGLNDSDSNTLALGIIEDLDLKYGKLSILTPLSSSAEVKAVRFGSLKLTPSGKEIGKVTHHD